MTKDLLHGPLYGEPILARTQSNLLKTLQVFNLHLLSLMLLLFSSITCTVALYYHWIIALLMVEIESDLRN